MTPDFPDFFVYPLFAVVLFLVLVFVLSVAALAVVLAMDLWQAVAALLGRLLHGPKLDLPGLEKSSRIPA